MCLSCARLGETCRSGHCGCVVSRAPSPAHSQESEGVANRCALNSSVPKLTGAEVAADHTFLPDSGAAIAYSIGRCICNTLRTHSFTTWRRPSHMQHAKDTFPHAPEASSERSLRLRTFAVQPTQFAATNGVYDYERSLRLQTEFMKRPANAVYD